MELIRMSVSQYADDLTLIIGLRSVVMPFTATQHTIRLSTLFNFYSLSKI